MGLDDLEELRHARHDIGLRDGLCFGDAQGMIAVGDVAVPFTDEALARDPPHRGEHAFVADAHAPEVPDHLVALPLVVHAAEILRRSRSYGGTTLSEGARGGTRKRVEEAPS